MLTSHVIVICIWCHFSAL